jgi:anti-anti-sigma factor
MALRITTDVDGHGVAILGVAGDLVTDTASQLTAAAAAVLTGHRVTQLVVDLARVARLDMDALHTLLRARDAVRQAGATFRVIRPQPPVRQVLHLTETCQLLTGAP